MSKGSQNQLKAHFPALTKAPLLTASQADYDVNKTSQTKPAHDDCKRAQNFVNKFVNHQQ